jgi:hypothetical protein
MRQLQRLYDMGELPEGLEPLIDKEEDGGNGEIYGVTVMTSADGRHRADIVEYTNHWLVMETTMPGGWLAPRSWKYLRALKVEEVAKYVREWGVDSASSPRGWFEECRMSDALAYLAFLAMGEPDS